ncbi:TonB-dependent receptor [uncultured Maribacter sp.]|uniref:SusC/RagA family TonB-linked outer membrane protein n=1 Tax=uncultured Maribacter sp. TaxID=431308 RepID=UPI0026373F31|nr:TonB-dependent receptor [uncultured Maribacter sp.]
MNRKTRKQIMGLAMMFLSYITIAQTAQVSGTVSDVDGPLPGVNIVVKGTTNGVTTDFDGNYTIADVAEDGVLVFSYIGYATQEITLNGQTTLNVSLEADAQALNEVVIVGYGTSNKRELTGSVSTIKKDAIVNVVASNPTTALQGKLAGIQVESFGGQPGGKANVFIRGVNSLSNADPLFIVDGLFVDNMNNINPNDIQDISVLKDAAASAIYGARAANGVVLIKTNHGRKNQGIKVELNLKTGFDTASKKLDFINGQQYTDYLNQRFENDGSSTRVTWNGVDTDWQDENISNAIIKDYGFSISGGGEHSSHYVSGNYFYQDGLLVGSGFERINFRTNNKFDYGKFHVTQSLGLTQGQLQENRWYGFDGTTAPTVALRNAANEGGFEAPDISLNVQGPGGTNQYARALLEDNLTTTRNVYASVKFDYDITDSFKAGINFGFDYLNTHIFEFTPTFFLSPSAESGRNINPLNDLTDFRQEDINLLVEPTLSYNKEFGEHKIGAVLGYTYFLESQNSAGLYGQGTDSNSIRVVGGLAADSQTILLGSDNKAGLESIFGRLNYNYGGKYIFSATVRRDASSRFAKENQSGIFPSFSGAWNLSSEPFWGEDSVVNYFKLRASYGELGSYPDVFYPTQAVFLSNQSNALFGNETANGLARTTLADPDLVWETTKTIDVGLDMSLFDGKVNFSADYYSKDISDVLVQIAVPSTTGVNLPVTRNAGDLINNGLEFVLDYKKREGDFTYTIGANISFNLKSEAGNIPSPILGPQIDENLNVVNRTISGEPIGAFYGYIVEDKVDPVTGDFVRVDTDGVDGITAADQTVIGDPTPDFTYGLNFNGAYKNFDFALGFNGVQGNEIYNLVKEFNIFTPDGGRLTDVLNAWTPTNTDTNIPKATVADGANNKAPSSFFVEDGSYFRLKTLEVGYNFKEGILGGDFIKDLRLSLNVQNVFVLTDYSGYDPDVSSTDGGRASLNSGVPGVRTPVNPLLSRGIDARAYPNARTFTFGVKATF